MPHKYCQIDYDLPEPVRLTTITKATIDGTNN